MKNAVRRAGALLVTVALTVTLLGSGSRVDLAASPRPAEGGPAELSASPLSPAVQQALVGALTRGEALVVIHLATEHGRSAAVAAAAQRLGAQVLETLAALDYVTVRLDPKRVPALAKLPGVTGLSLEARYRAGEDPSGTSYSGNPKPPALPSDPDNFTANRDALRADAFTAETGANGRGVTIALIDTGVDPTHPDLQTTSSENVKLVDWQDFSGEGDVDTGRTGRLSGGRLATPWGTYIVPAGLSKSGLLHFGLFRESFLAGGDMGQDINRNGKEDDSFAVLVADQAAAGRYDTVLVDTNGDHRFTDEKALGVFAASRGVGVFGDPQGEHVGFVVTRLRSDGSGINLGFDGNGHGTHVAAVAAGSRSSGSGISGIAPGASVMALKALDSNGDGGWDNISRAMIYAAEHGARIISMSVEGSTDHSGQSPESQLMARLSKLYNVLFITAAGNGGPGIGSAGFPGAPSDVISVGASMTPDLWKRYYGLTIPRRSLLEFSAAGPRRDGTMGPTLVAPGVAVSAVPVWYNYTGYDFKWGTSMAVPHVAGAAADLLSAAQGRGISPSYRGLKAAMEDGAQPIRDYQIVEQGFGQMDLPGAWQALLNEGSLAERPGPDVGLQALVPGQATEGLDARNYLPGWIPFVVHNPGAPTLRLMWRSTAGWIEPQRVSLTVPGGGTRILPVAYRVPADKGLYSALVEGYPVAAYGPDPTAGPEGREGPAVRILNTVVLPYDFSLANNWHVAVPGVVEVAQYRRYFFRVPEGAGRFDLSLSLWRGVGGRPTGRVEVFLFRPDGRLLQDSDVIGDGTGTSEYQVSVDTPMAGAWEAVVLTPADYAGQGQSLSLFQIEASLQGVLFPDGPIRVNAGPGQTDIPVTVSALNRKEPFDGSVVGVGLGQPVVEAPPELVTLREGEIATRDLPYVLRGTSLLRLSLTNPTRPGGQVTFSLYHKDEKTGQWSIVTPPGAAAGTQEFLDLPDPQPGQYVVSFIATELPGGQATYEYRQVILPGGDGIQTVDAPRAHTPGERWTIQAHLHPPLQPGRYYGRLIAKDRQGRTIGYVPVEVERGQTAARAYLLPQTLGQRQKGWVTVEFRDDLGRLVNPLVTINGATYQPRGGEIALPVGPSQTDIALHVVITDSDFAYGDQMLVQPVAVGAPPRDALGPAGTGQDFDWRYQKLLNEMGW